MIDPVEVYFVVAAPRQLSDADAAAGELLFYLQHLRPPRRTPNAVVAV